MTLTQQQKYPLLTIVVLIFCVATIGVFVSDMYLPSLPAIAHNFGVSEHYVQATIAVYLLTVSFSQLFYGPMSDRFGRKALLCLGLSIAFIGSVIGMLAHHLIWLVLGRAIQGIGMGSTVALFRSILRDVFSGKQLTKVLAWIGTFFSIAPAIAPVLGGYTEFYLGWRGTFMALSLYIGTSLILVMAFTPETNFNRFAALSWSKVARDYQYLLTHRVFIAHSLCASAIMCGLFAYLTISPFLFQTVLQLTPVEYGWTAVLVVAASLVGKLVNIRLVNHFEGWQLILIGIAAMLLAGASLLVTTLIDWLSIWAVLLPCMSYIFAGGIVFTNAVSNALTPFPKMAGTAGALYGCMQLLGGFIGSSVMTLWHANSAMPLAITFCVLAVLTALQYYTLVLRFNSSDKTAPSTA